MSLPSTHYLRNDCGHLAQAILAVQHKDQTQNKYAEHVQRERDEEEEEEAVVPPPNAVVHPGAVVVECLEWRKQTLLLPPAGP